MSETIEYIKTFLTYGNNEAAKRIGYTADKQEWGHYALVIIPSGHMEGELVYPALGTIIPQKEGKTIIISLDIIYNSFFFLSRAEEVLNSQRDQHDRFIAAYSILGQDNRLQMPLVDEYARTVCKLLDIELPKPQFSQILLTHDIDTLTNYRHIRGALGGIRRGQWHKVKQAWHHIYDDPAYTFPWLIQQDKKVPHAQTIYFVKMTRGRGYDYPQYCLKGRDWRRTQRMLENSGAQLGIHGSYYEKLPNGTLPYTAHRSHYLRCSLGYMKEICERGITDDYTMGFADEVGFRLQTTRVVRWINPVTRTLTNLMLHPLLVMDNTLTQYMQLTEDEAYFLCQRLIDKVRQHGGEVCLLWHNSNINDDSYLKTLYPKILELLR